MGDTCLFAHFDRLQRVADHVLYYLSALRQAGFRVIVISTADLAPADRGKVEAVGAELITRSNEGHDFGSWAAGLTALRNESGEIAIEGGDLLLANDSVYGPIHDLATTIERLRAKGGDVSGMVESRQIQPHLQSWFLLLRSRVYMHPEFQAFFRQDFTKMSKPELIEKAELGFSNRMRTAGFQLEALAPGVPQRGLNRRLRSNPSQFLWRSMLEQDEMPFIKVELLRDNPFRLASVNDWQTVVAERAPALAPLISRHLDEEWQTRGRGRNHAHHSDSHDFSEAFILNDDRFARSGSRICLMLNRWHFKLTKSTRRPRGNRGSHAHESSSFQGDT